MITIINEINENIRWVYVEPIHHIFNFLEIVQYCWNAEELSDIFLRRFDVGVRIIFSDVDCPLQMGDLYQLEL